MIGTVIGNYRIVSELARGGMGVVYRAEHQGIGQHAVIKQMLPDFVQNAASVARFFHEAKAAAAIDDPGIVKIFDSGTLGDGSAYITMELLKGESLAARLKRERLSPMRAAMFLRQAARAVGAAHLRAIVHRDLKPDNLFVVPDADVDGGERIKVLDFGIAKLADETANHAKTAPGVAMGTPLYMSPEQWSSASEVDARTDIYAFGCILHEMLVGTPPFRGPSLPELMDQHRFAAAPEPNTGTALDTIVARCLAKRPQDRYQSLDELVAALPDHESLPDAVPESSEIAPAPLFICGTCMTTGDFRGIGTCPNCRGTELPSVDSVRGRELAMRAIAESDARDAFEASRSRVVIKAGPQTRLCADCEHHGTPGWKGGGSTSKVIGWSVFVFGILMCFGPNGLPGAWPFLFIGAIFVSYGMSGRAVCSNCGSKRLLPLTDPVAQAILARRLSKP